MLLKTILGPNPRRHSISPIRFQENWSSKKDEQMMTMRNQIQRKRQTEVNNGCRGRANCMRHDQRTTGTSGPNPDAEDREAKPETGEWDWKPATKEEKAVGAVELTLSSVSDTGISSALCTCAGSVTSTTDQSTTVYEMRPKPSFQDEYWGTMVNVQKQHIFEAV